MKKHIRTFLTISIIFLVWFEGYTQSYQQERLKTDTTDVDHRSMDKSKIDDYHNDPDFQYGEASVEGMSLWSRIKLLIGLWLAQLFALGGESNWVQYLIYFIGVTVIIYVILKILKIDIRHVFYRPARQSPIKHRVIDDDIHEMNLDELIKQALDDSDYREAIRLVYLAALKELSSRDHLQWKVGKTNHEYMNELMGTTFQKEFDQLSYYFDYSWYGQFSVDQAIYDKVSFEYDNLLLKASK